MPEPTTTTPTVPERLAIAAREVEEARGHMMRAAKVLHCDLIPSELHRDVLYGMDSCRESLQGLGEFAGSLARGHHHG